MDSPFFSGYEKLTCLPLGAGRHFHSHYPAHGHTHNVHFGQRRHLESGSYFHVRKFTTHLTEWQANCKNILKVTGAILSYRVILLIFLRSLVML